MQEATKEAKVELPITGRELVSEIGVLLDDYFVGKFQETKEGVLYEMPNGQKFLIQAEEIK